MGSPNTVEYRATLDVKGIQVGAAEAAKAMASIDGQGAAEGVRTLSAEATRLGQNFKTATDQASAGLKGLGTSSTEASHAQAAANAIGERFLATLRDQIAVSSKSAEELLRYRAAQSGVAAEAAPLILQLQNQRAAQEAAAAAARQEEATQREAAAAKQRATAAQDAFIAGLREQIALQGKSSAEVLQYRATQLGVSEAASQYINQISDANKKGAISAGQHAQAMRMLPAQMTDVVTSVASGMPIWMVAIQQGGQIKDSFGGAGNAARAMLGAITPLTAGLAAGTAVIGLTAAAYYQGSAEADGFRKALVMTGNTAGVTVSQMSEISKAVGDVVGGQHSASQALTQLAGTGAIAGESLQQFTTVAMNLERYAGQPIKKTAEDLAKLGDEPVKASIRLNEQYHYLTESVYRQIKALDDQGRRDDAAALAQKTYADAMAERAGTMKSNLGTLERAWETLGNMASKTWNAMLNVGRAATLEDIRSKIAKTNDELNGLLAGDGFASTAGGAALGGGANVRARRIEELKKQLSELQASAAPLEAEDAQAALKAEQQANEDAKIAARQRTDALRKETRSRKAIRDEEIAQLNRDRETLAMGQDEYDKLLAGINKKYKDANKPSTGGINITDNQLAGLQSQLEAAKQYYEQLQTLGAGASELNAGERESLKLSEQITKSTNAKTRAKLEEAKAIADALGAQQRTNDGLEKTFKAEQQQHDAMVKGTDAIIQRAKDQEAANAVVGKGRTAIEQMTLAELEHQLTQAQGKGASDQQIADLETRIEAQKRWVGALGQADYKAVMAHADEMLRNAQELSKVYEDELALTGLTGLEREKIVAARQVELKYAKAIDAVNKGTLSDTEKEAARRRLNEARDIESAAAVAKAQQNHMAKASEEINRSLTDALMRGFDDGKGMAENLADTTVNLFKTMVLRPTISAVMTPVSLAINGVVQQGLNSVGLGGGMPSGSFTDWSSLGSTAGDWLMTQSTNLGLNGMQGLSNAAFGLGNTIKGVDAWLKNIPGMSGGIGSALGYGGALMSLGNGNYGSAVGQAIGTWALPGIGTMIGGALGGLLDGSFGSRGANHVGGTYSSQGLNDREVAISLGFRGNSNKAQDLYKRSNAELDKSLEGLAGGLLSAYNGLIARTGGNKLGINAGFAANPKYDDEESYGYFQLIDEVTGKVLAKYDNRDLSKDHGKAWEQYSADMAGAFVGQLKAQDIPGWMRTVLDGLGEEITIDGYSAAMQQIAMIDIAFMSLGKTMGMFADMSSDMQTSLLGVFGTMENLTASASSFYNLLYSEQERMTASGEQINATLKELGIFSERGGLDVFDGEVAKKKLRQAVEELMAAGNAEVAGKLMNMVQSFTAVADYSAKVAQETLKAQADTRKAATDSAWSSLQKSIEAERALAQERVFLAQERVDAEQALMDTLRSHVDELRGAVASTQAMAAARGNQVIDQALLTWRRTGYLPDASDMGEAAAAARSGIASESYRNRLDYESAQLVLANKLEVLHDAAGDQLTADELLLEQEKAQVDYLDQLLKSGKEGLEIARGTYVATRSIADAWRQYQDDLAAEKAGAESSDSSTNSSTDSSTESGGGAVWGPGGSGDSAAPTKYKKAVAIISGGLTLYESADAQRTAHLDTLADTFHSFDGTGDLAGLAAAIKAKGGTASDLAYLYGASERSVLAALDEFGIPHFDQGINFVPYDMDARIHAGETVMPARFNPFNPNATSPWGVSDNSEVVIALNSLQSLLYDIGRQQLVLLQSLEGLARKNDAIGVKQRTIA